MSCKARFGFTVMGLAALAMTGCGDDAAPPVPTDAGGDAGVSADAAPATDAGVGADASLDGGVDGGADAGGDAMDAGGGVDGGGGGTDGSMLPGYDAGDPFGDGGALGTPPWVPLEVRSDGTMCPPLVPCGGDVVGTWDVGGGCVELPIPPEFMMCPGAMVTSSSARARGRVTFTAAFATRRSQWEIDASVFVPAICARFAGGCSAIEMAIAAGGPAVACSTSAAGDCDCDIRDVGMIDDMDGYMLVMNQIVSTTSSKRWDYCVEGMTMRYHDVSTTPPLEPGIISLTRR